jgi:hypothetical protein
LVTTILNLFAGSTPKFLGGCLDRLLFVSGFDLAQVTATLADNRYASGAFSSSRPSYSNRFICSGLIRNNSTAPASAILLTRCGHDAQTEAGKARQNRKER